MKGANALVIPVWIAAIAFRIVIQRITRSKPLTPSLKLLTDKLLKPAFICIAVAPAGVCIGDADASTIRHQLTLRSENLANRQVPRGCG